MILFIIIVKYCCHLLGINFYFTDSQTSPSQVNIHVEAFKQAIQENGSLSCSIAQVMPFGLPRSGKSSMYHRLLDRRPPDTPTKLNVPGSGSASTDVLTPRRMIQVKIDLEGCKPVGKALIHKDVSEKWTEVTSLEEEVERFVNAIHMQRMAKMKSDSFTTPSPAAGTKRSLFSVPLPSAKRPPSLDLDLSLINAITTYIGTAPLTCPQYKTCSINHSPYSS